MNKLHKIDKAVRSDGMCIGMMLATLIAYFYNRVKKTEGSEVLLKSIGTADILLGSYGMTRDACENIEFILMQKYRKNR